MEETVSELLISARQWSSVYYTGSISDTMGGV